MVTFGGTLFTSGTATLLFFVLLFSSLSTSFLFSCVRVENRFRDSPTHSSLPSLSFHGILVRSGCHIHVRPALDSEQVLMSVVGQPLVSVTIDVDQSSPLLLSSFVHLKI